MITDPILSQWIFHSIPVSTPWNIPRNIPEYQTIPQYPKRQPQRDLETLETREIFRGWGWCPFLRICFTSPKQIVVGDEISPRVGWCEKLGHRNQALILGEHHQTIVEVQTLASFWWNHVELSWEIPEKIYSKYSISTININKSSI